MWRSSSASRTMARLGPVSSRTHAFQGGDRVQPHDAIGLLADVALEVSDRTIGVLAEQSVLAPGVEPQGIELALQRTDVVTAVERGVEIQGSITQAVARFDQLAPRVGPDQPVDPQQSFALEGPHGGVGGRSEVTAALRVLDRDAERGQAVLDVADLGPGVSESEDAHGSSVRRPGEGGNRPR